MKGNIIYLPVDNTPGVIVRIMDYIWASRYAVIPLENSLFYNKGEVEIVLQSQCKYKP